VTLEDLLEEIVGEISDEHEDEREAVSKAGEAAYSVSGKENITTVRELFGRGPEEEEFSTLGGFLAARLGHIPKAGETHRESDLLFTVEEADRRRVHRVRIEPVDGTPPPPVRSRITSETSPGKRLTADS
jgi:CBS domain containing-hemolysin-like protein